MTSHEPQPTIIDQLRQRKSYLTSPDPLRMGRRGIISAIRIGTDNKFDPTIVAARLAARQQ
jgi:hypothetical protein